MRQEKHEPVKMFTARIPVSLHVQLRVLLAQQQKTIRQWLEDAVRAEVAKEPPHASRS